jgi:hypothetical protein
VSDRPGVRAFAKGFTWSISAVQILQTAARDRCIFSARSLLFFMAIPTSDARQMGFFCPPPTPGPASKKRKSLYFSL